VTAVLGAAGLRHGPGRPGVPAVTAVPTIFHGHPDGQTTLVRFVATGIDAPAGRLRVFDERGRLVGTAGMLRRGETLVGELWLPLTQPMAVRTRLETPVTRGVISGTQRLSPTPRLTLCWLTVADPEAIVRHVAPVPVLAKGVEAAALVGAGVRANPWRPPARDGWDHVDLLRIAVGAARARERTGVPVSHIALADPTELEPFVGAALAGSGVEVLLTADQVVQPGALGFGEARLVMARRVEQWLTEQTASGQPFAVVVGSDLDFAQRARAAVEEWNGMYAYPRILVGDGDAALAEVRRHLGATVLAPGGTLRSVLERRPGDVFQPLARAITPDDPTLDGIAARFAFPVTGVLVFNQSPFGQSDAVHLPDGTTRIVTDVPGLGYAFLPTGAAAGGAAAGAAEPAAWSGSEVATARHVLRLRRGDGAIASLVDRVTGQELVRPDGTFNEIEGAVLSGATIERLPDVGVRIRVRRVTPRQVAVSTMTLYDALPWVDITNEMGGGPGGGAWGFDVTTGVEELRWDVAGGSLAAAPPVPHFAPLRWVAMRMASGAVLLASRGTGGMAFDGARLTLHGVGRDAARPARSVRLRIGAHAGYLLPDDPWRFGFSLESLLVVPTSGRGDRPLPTFGRMIDVSDPAVAVVGVKPADDGVGVIVYLMDLAGVARAVTVRPALLVFDGATLTDLCERDLRPTQADPGGGVRVAIAERGYAAVRLLGVRLA
jgi:hypothetical protein